MTGGTADAHWAVILYDRRHADAHWAGVFKIHGGGFCAFHSREFIRRGSYMLKSLNSIY